MKNKTKQHIQKGISVAFASVIISSNILGPLSSVQAVIHQEENKIIQELELLEQDEKLVESSETMESNQEIDLSESVEDEQNDELMEDSNLELEEDETVSESEILKNQSTTLTQDVIVDQVTVSKIAEYVAGSQNEDGGVAEIVKYNPSNNKFYVINGSESTIHIVSLDELNQDPSQQMKNDKIIDLAEAVSTDGFEYGDVTSIDINTKLAIVVAAVQEKDYTKNGKIVVMDYNGNILKQFEATILKKTNSAGL